MPRQYSDLDRISRDPLGRVSQGTFTASNASLKERVGALRNLRPFAVMVWRTSPQLMAASLALRLVRALLPVITLFIGKLIIDDVVALVQMPHKPETLSQWLNMREAAVLVLDEPTAALDARSEFEVFKRFKELSSGKTAVLISHRFSSVRMADRILVLADGIVESAGTHDELMKQSGRYSELFELQAAGYR